MSNCLDYDYFTMKTKARLVKGKSKNKAFKLQAVPLTEDQITEFAAYYKKNKAFPGSKIPCTVTGKLTTCIGPWMVKKIKEYGSPEQLLRSYKCRGAMKAERQINKPVLKKPKRKNKIKELMLQDEEKNWNLPKMNFAPPRPMSKEETTQTTKTQCLRPDIFLSNGRHCEGCPHFDLCINHLKCLSPWTKENNKIIKRKL
jgi:hypothetical protein